jgi:hypothetical protein
LSVETVVTQPVICRRDAGHGKSVAVFRDQDDPDYRGLLSIIQEGKRALAANKRFDMPGFRPNEHYIREMKKYGILPANIAPEDPIDPYATDRASWRSLWHQPVSTHGRSSSTRRK